MEITYKEFQKALKTVKDYKEQVKNHYNIVYSKDNKIHKFAGVTKETKLVDLYKVLNIRILNILRAHSVLDSETIVKDLEKCKISELKRYQNFGKKSIKELEDLCFYAGVQLLK